MFTNALSAEKECKPFISYYGANYGNSYRHFTVPDDYTSVYCVTGHASNSYNFTFYLNRSELNGVTKLDVSKFLNTGYYVYIYKLPVKLSKNDVIALSVPTSGQYIQFYGISVGNGNVALNLSGDVFIGIA